MTKVAIFTNSLAGGGMERAMLNLADFLTKQGATVDFIIAARKGPLLAEAIEKTRLIDLGRLQEKKRSVRWWMAKCAISFEPLFLVILFLRRLPKSFNVIPALIDYIEQNSPDVIVSTPTYSNLAVLWATHYCGFKNKIIVREATTLSHELTRTRTLLNRLVKRLVTKWYNRANYVISVSNGVCKDLVEQFQLEGHRAIVLPNIIDVKAIRIKACSEEHDVLINQCKPYILSVGRLDETKDYATLIKAFNEIKTETNCKLVILGEGSERNKLEMIIKQFSLSGRVYLPGFVVNPYPVIKNCEVFALSSLQEGSPNVLKEALLFNKKIISTGCASAVYEVLRESKSSVVIPVGCHKSYSEGLLKLLHVEQSENYLNIDEIYKRSALNYRNLILKAEI